MRRTGEMDLHRNKSAAISFRCNLCGQDNSVSSQSKHRELLNCTQCGSSARARGVVYALQRYILQDTRTPLREAAPRKHLRGVGMSDWTGYGDELERIFDYANTFYHREPRLDVTDVVSARKYQNLNFVISSDVLEHVVAPVSEALRNIRRMLCNDGVLILTAPYVEGYESIEHFPHLHDFKIVSVDGGYVLENRTANGIKESFEHLIFHGGPGSTLEMRMFGEGDLLNMLKFAGFKSEILEPRNESIGYLWDDCVENLLYGGRRTKGYVLLCRPCCQNVDLA